MNTYFDRSANRLIQYEGLIVQITTRLLNGDIAQWLESRNSNLQTLAGQGQGQVLCFSESTLVQSCLCLTRPPSCARHEPKFVRTLKIPYPSVVKESSRWYGNTKHSTHGKTLGSAVLWLLAFPGESCPNFLCITLGKDSYVM